MESLEAAAQAAQQIAEAKAEEAKVAKQKKESAKKAAAAEKREADAKEKAAKVAEQAADAGKAVTAAKKKTSKSGSPPGSIPPYYDLTGTKQHL